MPKVRITARHYELQAAAGVIPEDGSSTQANFDCETSVELEDREASQNYERATRVPLEDGRINDMALGLASIGLEENDGLASLEQEYGDHDKGEQHPVQRYKRAASVEPEDRDIPMSYERASSLEPDYHRLATMKDDFDIPQAGRPAPPPPRHRVKDYISVQNQRKNPPFVHDDVMKTRKGKAKQVASPNVWLQRMVLDRSALPTLREGLRQRGISIIERIADVKVLDDREHDATMLDVSAMYRIVKDRLIDEQLSLAMEFVLHENPDSTDRTHLRDMSLERYLVDVGADMMSRSSGPHFTFVNPNFHNNVELIVEQALRLVKLFADNHGVVTDRLVVSIPATVSGMAAAKRLRSEYGVNTNLTLVSSVAHAAACLETGTNTISINHEKLFQGLKSWAAKTESTASTPTRPESSWRDVWAVGAAPREIRAISALLHMHSSPTKLLVSTMRQLDDLAFLPDIHGVVFNFSEIQESKEARLPFHVNPDSDATAKAKEIPYPSSYLSNDGILHEDLALSEKDQHVSRFILSNEANRLMAYQSKLEEKVGEALAYRLWVRDLDPLELEQMYEDDVYEEEMRQLEEKYLKLIKSPKKVNPPSPRTNHIGYRMAKTTWDPAFKTRSLYQVTVVEESAEEA